ncbi:hypothetical protein [Anaerosporobacter sp.]|uniref:hypothetical protein n=1 Tax=Anaerosporobacter sp. TaxID=1872529 RepID=UPI00286F7925|nr:hypothetical protein [Anaerosporobacter sp.]
MIKAVTGRIPPDIAVRLGKYRSQLQLAIPFFEQSSLLILLIFVGVTGILSCIYVTGVYLRSPEGREALENVKEVIYNGRRYLAKAATDFISWVNKKNGKTKEKEDKTETKTAHKIGENGTKVSSKTIQNLLKEPWIKDAIIKALKYLGEIK